MKKSYVYKITCLVTGEYYFGSSFSAKRDSYWGSGCKIRERIAQYGKENFVKEILGEFDDRTIAHQVENQYIEQFRNDEKCLNQMFNRHFGSFSYETCAKNSVAKRGEKNPNFGKHFSEEHRAKIGAALHGKTLSEERKERISASLKGLMSGEKNPMYGKHHTEETRAKISACNRGKIVSDDTRAKIGAAQRGKIVSDDTRAKISAALRGKFCGKHWRKNPITGKREWYD